jgi:agmatine/peptidylarginine deiminase
MVGSRRQINALSATMVWVVFLVLASGSRAQTTAQAKYTATDVVILSLEALNPQTQLRQHVQAGLVGNSDTELNVEKRLLDIQMNIVRATAKFGPVLLLAPDETTKTAIYQRCQEFQICELLRSDRVRMKIVVHDGVWIRDFGPRIDEVGDAAHVVHWRYFDIRTEEAKQEKLQELEAARLKLLETRQEEDQPDALTQESTQDARKAVASTIDDRLYLLREYTQILNEASPQRTNDDASAYDIADAVLAAPDFSYTSSPLALDGGNLFKLEDGRCLTTRVLLSRNKDQKINVDEELKKVGGCQEVTYLDPLPGGVIEHIDMFALPVGGKRILLASYDLSNPFAAEYWSKLSSAERDLALNAALAMDSDAELLKKLGYEVLQVPAPFPVIPANGHTYYPSALNVLIREGADASRQVLAPSFKDYETDIQAAALKEIAAALGPKTEIVPIEATEAAKSQGAIHCLTLTAPLQLSIFGDSAGNERRTEALVRKEELDKQVAAQIAAQIPASGLEGLWAILAKDERADERAMELYPQRIFFGEHEFQKGVFDQLESSGKYAVDKKDAGSWSVHFVFADQTVTPAVVQWLNKGEVKLIFADGDSSLHLRRITSASVSPFKRGHEAAHASHGNAAKSGKAPEGLEPVQPQW